MIGTLYDYKNNYNSNYALPSTTHIKNTGLAMFFKDYLLKKVFGLYDIDLPEVWDVDYVRYALFLNGFIATFDEGVDYGVIPQHGSLTGYNVFYRPDEIIITNPVIKGTRRLKIDVDCTIIKLTPNYKGIYDIVDYYGDLMAICAEGVGMNIVNTKLAYVFTATDKGVAESFKKLFDKIQQGDPAVVIDKKLMNEDGTPAWTTFVQNLQQNFITNDLLEAMNTIENKFDQLVGIPNANTDKRERLISSEVDSNNIDTRILADVIYDTLKKGIDKHNKMFPDYKISIRYKYELGGELNEQRSMVISNWNGGHQSASNG